MVDPVEARFTLDRADYRRAARFYLLRGAERSLGALGVLGLIVTALLVLCLSVGRGGAILYAPAAILILAIGTSSVLSLLAVRRVLRQAAPLSLGVVIMWRFTDDGVEVASENARAQSAWKEVAGFLETREYFLLSRVPGQFNIIPRRGFASEADIGRFRSLLASRIGARPKA